MSARDKDRLIPRTRQEFDAHRERFEAWLVSRGAEVLERTNEWEVARFTTAVGIAVVHADKKGNVTSWGNGSRDAFMAYRTSESWRATKRPTSHGGKWKRERIEAVLKRDGDTCCFCGLPMPDEDMTLEHFVPAATGGSNHTANLMLAHGACNREAARLPARQKIELIIRKRREGVTP